MAELQTITSFIAGRRVAPGGASFDFVRPQDGAVVFRVAEAGEETVAAAVAAAKATFEGNRKARAHQRIAWLKAGAAALAKGAEELALLISEDVGKPIRIARGEVKRGVEFVEAC